MSENSKTLNSFIYLFCELYEIPKRTGRVDRGHTENCKINWLIFTRHRMHRIAPIYLYRRRSFRGLCEGPKEPGIRRGLCTGATWQIQLNDPCSAAMRPYVKLLFATCFSGISLLKLKCQFTHVCPMNIVFE